MIGRARTRRSPIDDQIVAAREPSAPDDGPGDERGAGDERQPGDPRPDGRLLLRAAAGENRRRNRGGERRESPGLHGTIGQHLEAPQRTVFDHPQPVPLAPEPPAGGDEDDRKRRPGNAPQDADQMIAPQRRRPVRRGHHPQQREQYDRQTQRPQRELRRRVQRKRLIRRGAEMIGGRGGGVDALRNGGTAIAVHAGGQDSARCSATASELIGRMTPRSVISAVMRSAGVTSKAGL